MSDETLYNHEPFDVDTLLPAYASPKLREVWAQHIQESGATAPDEPSPLMLLSTPLGLIPLVAVRTRYKDDMVGLEHLTIDNEHYLLVHTHVNDEEELALRQHPNYIGFQPPETFYPFHTLVFSKFTPENLEAYVLAQESFNAHQYLYTIIQRCQEGYYPWWHFLQRDWETQIQYQDNQFYNAFRNSQPALSPEEQVIEDANRAELRLKAWSDGWDGDGTVPLPIPENF